MKDVNYEQLWGEMCISRLIFAKNRGKRKKKTLAKTLANVKFQFWRWFSARWPNFLAKKYLAISNHLDEQLQHKKQQLKGFENVAKFWPDPLTVTVATDVLVVALEEWVSGAFSAYICWMDGGF